MVHPHGPYSPEFRTEAIKLVVEVGHPIEFVSEKLAIPLELLTTWVEEHLEELDEFYKKEIDSLYEHYLRLKSYRDNVKEKLAGTRVSASENERDSDSKSDSDK